jgi:sugar phosphate isomerase/epimerase
LENEDATLVGSCQEARTVANALGDSSGFSFCWDVTNGIVCDEPAYPDGYHKIRGRITHLHVKPNGQGELDPIEGSETTYDELLRHMLTDGYEGAASIEHWHTPAAMLKGIRDLRKVIDELVA